MKVGVLSLIYWGAALMWLADAIIEYISVKADYFTPAPAELLNDLYLGLYVVALGLVIWLIYLLIKDPKGFIKGLFHKEE